MRFGLKRTLRCVIWVKFGAEAASEGEQPGLVDCTLYFVIRIGLFAYRVRLFSARVGLFFVGGGLFFG